MTVTAVTVMTIVGRRQKRGELAMVSPGGLLILTRRMIVRYLGLIVVGTTDIRQFGSVSAIGVRYRELVGTVTLKTSGVLKHPFGLPQARSHITFLTARAAIRVVRSVARADLARNTTPLSTETLKLDASIFTSQQFLPLLCSRPARDIFKILLEHFMSRSDIYALCVTLGGNRTADHTDRQRWAQHTESIPYRPSCANGPATGMCVPLLRSTVLCAYFVREKR